MCACAKGEDKSSGPRYREEEGRKRREGEGEEQAGRPLDVRGFREHVGDGGLRYGRRGAGSDHRLEALRRNTVRENVEPARTCGRK
jgi:hypothetical protein